MSQYLQTSHSRVGSIGKLLPGQLAGSALVTRDPAGQEALVAGAVGDGVGGGAWQADQHCMIGQAHIGQAHSHPLAVKVAGPGLFAFLRLARERTAEKGGQKTKSEMFGQFEALLSEIPVVRVLCRLSCRRHFFLPEKNPPKTGDVAGRDLP